MAATRATALRAVEVDAATAQRQQIAFRQFEGLIGRQALENIDPGFLFARRANVFSQHPFTQAAA